MAGFGDAVENALLDVVLRGVPWAQAAADRFSLHTADPGETGANEVTGGGYARGIGAWAAASGGSSLLAGPVDFTNLPAVTVTHFGVWTPTSVFVGGGPTTTRTLVAGDSYRLGPTTHFDLD